MHMPSSTSITRRRHLYWLASSAACISGLPSTSASAPSSIKFGQSAPVSGHNAHLGLEYNRGLRLAFDEINARGGVQGREMELVLYDDAHEPAIAMENTTNLIGVDKVFALLGYVGSATTERCMPLASRAGVPMLAPLTGAQSLRQAAGRLLWHLRPSYSEELRLLAQAIATVGYRRVAVLMQNDQDGEAALQALKQAMADAQLPAPSEAVRIESDYFLNADGREKIVTQAGQRLLATQPQAVIFLSVYAWTAALLKQLRKTGYVGPAYAISLASAASIGALLGPQAAGLMVTQVVPSPFHVALPMVAAYQKRLHQSDAAAVPEYVSLEGWMVGMAIAQALRLSLRRAPALRRDDFMSALEELKGYDLGGFILGWDQAKRQASSRVTLTILDATGRPRV